MDTLDVLTDIGIILNSLFPVFSALNRYKLRSYKLIYFITLSILDLINIVSLFITTHRLSLSSNQLCHAMSCDYSIN